MVSVLLWVKLTGPPSSQHSAHLEWAEGDTGTGLRTVSRCERGPAAGRPEGPRLSGPHGSLWLPVAPDPGGNRPLSLEMPGEVPRGKMPRYLSVGQNPLTQTVDGANMTKCPKLNRRVSAWGCAILFSLRVCMLKIFPDHLLILASARGHRPARGTRMGAETSRVS